LFSLPALLGAPHDLRLTGSEFGDGLFAADLLEGARQIETVSPTLMRLAHRLGRDDVRLEKPRASQAPVLSRPAGDEMDAAAVAVFCEADDSQAAELVLQMARSFLVDNLPWYLVLFGRQASPAMLATTRVINGADFDHERIADLLRLHATQASLCLMRTKNYEHPVQDLLLQTARPLFSLSASLVEPLDIPADDLIVLPHHVTASAIVDALRKTVPVPASLML
jgi:hypothetical protein